MKTISSFRRWLGHFTGSFPDGRPRPARACHSLEALEARIAPATLVNPTTVTFTDTDGDHVTVTISKGLFRPANVNKVFHFDQSSVNGHNDADQQLQLLDLTRLHARTPIDVTITTATAAFEGADGVVNVGYIKAAGYDLGNVTVSGDLGRIDAGNRILSTPALGTLEVGSLGVEGLATQAAGGKLSSNIAGAVGALIVDGDILNASIGVGGGAHPANGSIGAITVDGSIIGGAADFSGSIRATGNIGAIQIGGDLQGGGGMSSGHIGTAGTITSAQIDGSIIGDAGAGSGTLLSTGAMGQVTVGAVAGFSLLNVNGISRPPNGNVLGGSGDNSGQIGTASTLAGVTIHGNLEGGGGLFSGAVLSGGNMGAVHVFGDVIGGTKNNSGQIGSAGNLTSVTVDGSVTGGSAAKTGAILSSGDMGAVQLGALLAGSVSDSGEVLSNGKITSANITNDVTGTLFSLDTLGDVTIGGLLNGGDVGSGAEVGAISALQILSSTISSAGDVGTIDATNGIHDSSITAFGAIGVITVTSGSIADSTFTTSDPDGAGIADVNVTTASDTTDSAISNSTFKSANAISAITVTSGGIGIDGSIFLAKKSIGNVTASTSNSNFAAISASAFDAGDDIGVVDVTGNLQGSLFVAGTYLGDGFASDLTHTGNFDNTASTGFGFGSSNTIGSATAKITSITLHDIPLPPNSEGSSPATYIQDTTFLSGVTGAGTDGTYGTNDDAVSSGTTIGPINAPGGMTHVTVESGAIGTTTVTEGNLNSVNYLALSATVGTGIDDINVTAPIFSDLNGIESSNFYTKASIGKLTVVGDDTGIYQTTFDSEASFGDIDVTGGFGSGIGQANFRAGATVAQNGGFGSIHVTMGESESPTVDSAIFTTAGHIGAINIDGEVDNSGFYAGVDLGSDFAFGGFDNLVEGGTIGDVTISGRFIGSDLIASVAPHGPVANHYGINKIVPDVNVGNGGSIGNVSIYAGSSDNFVPIQTWSNSGEVNGIEAKTIGTVMIGGNTDVPVTSPGSEVDWYNDGFGDATVDIAVREIGQISF